MSTTSGFRRSTFAPQQSRLHLVAGATALLLSGWSPFVQAQAVNSLGTSGGLSIPDAGTLGVGTLVLGIGNAPEPQIGPYPRPRSLTLGAGMLPGLDIIGRFAEYARRPDGFDGLATSGISDISVNAKYSLALGAQDAAGAAVKFRAVYGVATLTRPRWEATLGVGHSTAGISAKGADRALDGVFGGVHYRLPALAAVPGEFRLAAEYDGRQPLLGLRWESPAWAALANGRLTASLHRSFEHGAVQPAATVVNLSLALPFGETERKRPLQAVPAATLAALTAVPAERLAPTAALSRVKARLVAQGLERVRVGRLADGSWVVTYQNRRYGHNEMDALGIAAGVAAQAAPAEVPELWVVALKQGQPVLTMQTRPSAWRDYLRTSASMALRDVTRVRRGGLPGGLAVDWVADLPGPATRVQLQIAPDLATAFGNEIAAYSYSLAGRVRATAPLWEGGQLVATGQAILDTSRRAEQGQAFEGLRQPDGLTALAVHQTLWLGRRAVVGAAVGRFAYDAWGVEGEAHAFVPGRDDTVVLRGRATERTDDMPQGYHASSAMLYRWVASPTLWAEAGWQRYTDGSGGPSLALTRWWGDVGLQMFYRKGGNWQFAGLEVVLPLTPRAAPVLGNVLVEGDTTWQVGARTMVRNPWNYSIPRAAREMELAWDLESGVLNGGRLGPEYVLSQFPRMREAFFALVKQGEPDDAGGRKP